MPSSGVRVILFGSQARGDSNEASDWDLIVFWIRISWKKPIMIYIPIRYLNWDGRLMLRFILCFILLKIGNPEVFLHFIRMWKERE